MRIMFVKIDQGLEKLLDKKSWKVNEEHLLKILVIHLVFIGATRNKIIYTFVRFNVDFT